MNYIIFIQDERVANKVQRQMSSTKTYRNFQIIYTGKYNTCLPII